MKKDILGEMSGLKDKSGFLDFIKDIKDHRIDRKKLHSVGEIIFLAFCGYIANCNSWEDLESFGHTKLEFLRKFLPYTNGIPSDDTLRRFFRVLDPKVFEDKFEQWVSYIFAAVDTAGKVIAIDGKASRGSHDGEEKAIHVVSAFVGEDKITLAQRKVDCKTNEIKVIPELLDALDLKAAIVTIDAMGTQHKIANKIIEKKANYILSLKGNQQKLEKDVKEIFTHVDQIKANDVSIHESSDAKNHGRMEQRICTVITDPAWIKWLKDSRKEWYSINCVIRISSTRTIKGVSTTEDRFYISSLTPLAENALNYIRTHWAIENCLHWTLDVSFGDDKSRIRKGNAPQNMLVIKKAALNLLEIIKARFPRINGVRMSIARLRKLTSWVDEWLLNVLCAKYEPVTK